MIAHVGSESPKNKNFQSESASACKEKKVTSQYFIKLMKPYYSKS